MKITITDGNSVHSFDVDPQEEVENLKALIEVEMGIPSDRQQLTFQGKPLNDKDKLQAKGVTENQLLYLIVGAPKQNKPKMGIADMIKSFDKNRNEGGGERFMFEERNVDMFMGEAQKIYSELKDDPDKLALLSDKEPEIASMVVNNDVPGIAKIIKSKHDARNKKIAQERKRFMQLSKDPMNPEYQKMLEERIHQENIDKNLQFAQEYVPELFGQINMLYINATINKVPIQAFVDSGAQMTIMSEQLAERCGLLRLMDKRYASTAVGVGTAKILGRIHAAQIQIEKKHLTCSFNVIENNSMEFLLGLDMLKRFSCILDLRKNELNFDNGTIITKFLSDGEIKKTKVGPKKEELEAKVSKITAMGFSRDDALRALKTCNYNEQIASSMLMRNKFGQ